MSSNTQSPIFINGRFFTQPVSGVQRFSREIATQLQQIYAPHVQFLVPRSTTEVGGHLVVSGRLTGQAWEQCELPGLAKTGFLINLGNTAPIFARRQLVVIHDAGIFATPDAYSWKFRQWSRVMQRLLVQRGTLVVTVSEFSRYEIIRHLKAPPAQVTVIPEGSDHMHQIKADPSVLGAHGLKAGRYVLAVGTLAAHKNLASLGALAQRLAQQNFALVVTGSLGGAVFKNHGLKNLPQPAHYVGRVSDAQLKSLYQNAACHVFPSLYEGFGLTALEAMACGCPVIASNIAVLHETCGKAALFCDMRKPEMIAETVLHLLVNPTLQGKLKAVGFEHVHEMTWQRAAFALSRVIEDKGLRE